MSARRSILICGLVAAVSLALAGGPAHAIEQVTDDDGTSGCSSVSPVTDETGMVSAWESDCDPATTNADGSVEIFRATAGGDPAQLTFGAACASRRPSIDSDGDRVAFESNCDLLGSNADGNVEIYIWKNGTVEQLTNSTGCDNLAPSISGNGNFIAFDSTCNIFGTINDGRGSEIYRVSAAGVLEKLTTDPGDGNCDSTSVSSNDKGNLIAFDSDCDLTGENEDFAIEVFTVNGAGVVKQRTFAPDDSCSNMRPSLDGAGTLVAFQSDCDLIGENPDGGTEVFTTVLAGGEVEQISEDSGESACVSSEARLAFSGLGVAFSSYCALGGGNGDGSIEVFHAGLGEAAGGILAVTADAGCANIAGGISADGTRVLLDSECDPIGANADGSVEIFVAGACECGAPSTRLSPPKASDALRTLQAAVGSAACQRCECDTNDDGSIAASDALRVLKAAVGQPGVELLCPVP